jgi:hypothetical protein
MFDQLCPLESPLRTQKRQLCIVLICTNHIPEHEEQRQAMRAFIQENAHSLPKDRFRFMYVFKEKQPEFVRALIVGLSEDGDDGDDPAGDSMKPKEHADDSRVKTSSSRLNVVVLERKQSDKVLYEWLPFGWDISSSSEDADKQNTTKTNLSELLIKLWSNREKFTHKAKVMQLIDEQAKGLFGRIVKKIFTITDHLTDNITRKEVLPFVSVILSIGFIVLVGYIMSHLV